MPTSEIDPSLKLVADKRRRELIDQLRQNGTGEVTIDTLVDRMNESEQAASTEPPPDRERLAIELYHTHLPQLADLGVVEYDPERKTVRYRPDEQVEAVLDSLPE